MKKINFKILIGASGIFLIVLAALLAPWIRPYNPLNMELSRLFAGPTLSHPFGLDENGIDLLSQVLYGARLSLLVSFTVVFISLFIGLVLGSISAWKGSLADQVLMRLVDMVSAFPRFLLALALLAMMGSSVVNLIVAMCISGWAGFARLVRAEVLHLKKEEYVLSALSMGTHPLRVMVCHIWPNLLGVLMVQAAVALSAVVIAEAGLSFLGLGAPPELPSWGRLLAEGRGALESAPHLSFFPGVSLFFLIFSFHLCGDGLRDLLDPNVRSK